MIINIDKKNNLLANADALVAVIGTDGVDRSGALKHFADIQQVVQMMAVCKEIKEDSVFNFRLERGHLFIITDSRPIESLQNVFQRCEQMEVKSINVPDIESISMEIWGLDTESNIEVKLCPI